MIIILTISILITFLIVCFVRYKNNLDEDNVFGIHFISTVLTTFLIFFLIILNTHIQNYNKYYFKEKNKTELLILENNIFSGTIIKWWTKDYHKLKNKFNINTNTMSNTLWKIRFSNYEPVDLRDIESYSIKQNADDTSPVRDGEMNEEIEKKFKDNILNELNHVLNGVISHITWSKNINTLKIEIIKFYIKNIYSKQKK